MDGKGCWGLAEGRVGIGRMRNQVHRGRYRRKAVDGGGARRLEGSWPAEVGQPQDIQARSGSPPTQFVLLIRHKQL